MILRTVDDWTLGLWWRGDLSQTQLLLQAQPGANLYCEGAKGGAECFGVWHYFNARQRFRGGLDLLAFQTDNRGLWEWARRHGGAVKANLIEQGFSRVIVPGPQRQQGFNPDNLLLNLP